MEEPKLTVIETFSITGRGLVVVLDGFTGLPVGKALTVRITRPDGSTSDTVAYKEWLLRRSTPPVDEHEAFILRDIEKMQAPLGSTVQFVT